MEQDKKTTEKTTHTYAEDMASIIQNDTGSLVKKMIHEEEEHEDEKKKESPESKKNKSFMYISLLLVILSLIILYFFLFRMGVGTVATEKIFTPIIFNDQYNYQEVLGLKKEEIVQSVVNQINATKVKDGGIEGIYLTENKQIIGLRRFISLIKSSFVPGDNIFVSDNYLMGVVKNQVNTNLKVRYGFFILLKVRSTGDAFNSMSSWESNMMTDLSGFVGIDLSSETSYLFKKNFEDSVIENKNARILYDSAGKVVLMYVYADDNSIIITNSESAIHEIILRLFSSKTKQ